MKASALIPSIILIFSGALYLLLAEPAAQQPQTRPLVEIQKSKPALEIRRELLLGEDLLAEQAESNREQGATQTNPYLNIVLPPQRASDSASRYLEHVYTPEVQTPTETLENESAGDNPYESLMQNPPPEPEKNRALRYLDHVVYSNTSGR